MARRTLIDTHVAIWVGQNESRLSKTATQMLGRSSQVCVSTISVAEIEIKALRAKKDFHEDLLNSFIDVGLELVDFDFQAAKSLGRFMQLTKHDPFDRLILAHAASLDAIFLTADKKLLDLGLDWVIDASA